MQWIDAHNAHPRVWSLYVIGVGTACGILCRSFFIVDMLTMFLVTIGIALGLSIFGMRVPNPRRWVLFAGGVFALMFLLGTYRMSLAEQHFNDIERVLAPALERKIALSGTIVGDVEARGTLRIFTIETNVANDDASLHAFVEVRSENAIPLTHGDQVEVRATLKVPESFETDLGRTFPYASFMRAHDVSAVMSYADVILLETGNRWNLRRMLFAFKHRFMATIEFLLPEPAAGLANGLVLGAKHALPSTLEDAFRMVGIVHIIVLSGYNLSIVAEFVMRFLGHLLMPRPRLILGGASIVLFALMVGLSATVLRASLMALLVLLARATGNTYLALRALILAGCAMILWNPYVLAFDPGFQLSFLATFGLIICSPLVERVFTWIPSRLGLREFVVSTIATQIVVAPILVYSMGTASTVFLIANILVLIVVPFTMFLVAITGFLGMLFGALALPIAYLPYLLLSYIVAVAEILSRVPYASFSIPPFSFAYVVAAYTILTVCIIILHTKTAARPKARGGPQSVS